MSEFLLELDIQGQIKCVYDRNNSSVNAVKLSYKQGYFVFFNNTLEVYTFMFGSGIPDRVLQVAGYDLFINFIQK